jgi:hypothetical protein
LATEEALSKKTEREIAVANAAFKQQLLADVGGGVKAMLPSIGIYLSRGQPAIATNAIEQFLDGLTDDQKVALLGRWAGGIRLDPGLLDEDQARLVGALADGEVPLAGLRPRGVAAAGADGRRAADPHDAAAAAAHRHRAGDERDDGEQRSGVVIDRLGALLDKLLGTEDEHAPPPSSLPPMAPPSTPPPSSTAALPESGSPAAIDLPRGSIAVPAAPSLTTAAPDEPPTTTWEELVPPTSRAHRRGSIHDGTAVEVDRMRELARASPFDATADVRPRTPTRRR